MRKPSWTAGTTHAHSGSAVEAVSVYNPLMAKAMGDKTIGRRNFLGASAAFAGAVALGNLGRVSCARVESATFPGIRWFPSLGVHTGAQPYQPDPGFAQRVYDKYAAPREAKWFLGSPRFWFTAEKKVNWRDLLVDERRAPKSHTQARNPGWANYRWNQSPDIFREMLSAPCIAQGRAKLGLFVAATATAEPDPVPQWMTGKGLTWVDSVGRVHVRVDLEEGWRWMADMFVALVRRYGNDPRIGSLVMGEYYPSDEGRPAGFDFGAYRANAKKVWADVIASAPQDTGGNRLNIVQSNPIMTGGVIRTADIAELKLGVTGSDPHLFISGCDEPNDVLCDPGSINRARQNLYGVVPLQHQGNANVFYGGGDPVVWTGIANPFGYTRGQVVNTRLEHGAWYFGSKGIIPLNGMTVKDAPAIAEQWFGAFDRFGPRGTDAAAWGQLPN